MASFNYLVPKGGGCHHPNLPKLKGTGPKCAPRPDDNEEKSTAKTDCIRTTQERISKTFNKVRVSDNNAAIKAANAELSGYFNMCPAKHDAACHIFYPDHITLKQERILREATVAARFTAIFDSSALNCACTSVEEAKECICDIPLEQRVPDGPTTRKGVEDSQGVCICEEPECECEVPTSPDDKECQETNSSGCGDGEQASCDEQIKVGLDPRDDVPEWGYMDKPGYGETLNDPECEMTKDINLRPAQCVKFVCEGGDDTDTKDDPQPEDEKETVPGTWVSGRCECEDPDESEDDERFTSTFGSNTLNFPAKDEKPASNAAKDTESLIDLLPSSTVSLYDYPLEYLFGKHFVNGNIFWVEKINKISSIEVTLSTDYTSSFGTPRLFGSGTVTETELSVRDIRFAVGICSTGIDAVKRVWLEGDLIYDETDPHTETNTIPIHYGGETQKVDERMARTVGFGRTPAYRDMVYIMLDREDIIHEIPQVRVEVVSHVDSSSEIITATSSVTLPGEVSDDRLMIDYNQQKIFQSMSGGRLRVVDYITLEELEIIQFPPLIHMESVLICDKAEYFMAQMPTKSSLRPYGDAFFDKTGRMIYSPHEDIDTQHYAVGQTNDFLKKYAFNTRTRLARKYPILTTTINSNAYVVSTGDGTLRTHIVDDLFMYVRDLVTSNTSTTNEPQTLNAVKDQKFRFPGKGDMYVTGHLGATGFTQGIHMGIKIVQAGNARIADTMNPIKYRVLPISQDDLGIYAADIVIVGTVLYGNSAILFGHYANGTNYFMANWSMLDGIQWVQDFEDIIPFIGPDITLNTNTFHFISAGPVPKLYTMNVSTGAIKVTQTDTALVPYKTGLKSWMFYDGELGAITYFTDQDTFVNVFPTQRVERPVVVDDVFQQIERGMKLSGANITFGGGAAAGVGCEGFRTGSHLSWAAALTNFATTYDLNIYEDEHITATPNKPNAGQEYPFSTFDKTHTSDDGTANISSLSLQYYDSKGLGDIKFVLINDPYLTELGDNINPFSFVSGGLMDSQYAYSLAEVILYNKNNKIEVDFTSMVGMQAVLVAPGERVFGPFLANKISTGKSSIQMSGPSSLSKAIEAPLFEQPVVGSLEKFRQAQPLAKPILIRSPLQPMRITGYHSGKVGYQVGLVDIPTRGGEQLLDGSTDTVSQPVQWGRTLVPMKGVVNHFTTDYDNIAKVMFNVPPQVPPVNRTMSELLEDDTLNVLVCGTETVQFMTAVQDAGDPRVWTFSGFFRGRFGSEDGHEDHMLNELCVLNDKTNTRVILYDVKNADIFNKMSAGFLIDNNPATNDTPNFPVFEPYTHQLYRSRRNVGTIWAYDDFGRAFSPVNVERIDDPDTNKTYFIWKGRDPADIWFKNTLLPYTKRRQYDFRLSPIGGIYSFSGIEDGSIYQYHQIDRRYRARITQSDSDGAFGNNTTLRFGPGQEGVTTELGYLNPSTFGNPIYQQENERHKTGAYVVDMSNKSRWGSLPAGYVWDWMEGYGLHREFASGTKVIT